MPAAARARSNQLRGLRNSARTFHDNESTDVCPASYDSEQWSPERAATLLRFGLWLILGAGGVALVHFTASNARDRVRDVSDQLEVPEQDSLETDGPTEYSKWEPAQ